MAFSNKKKKSGSRDPIANRRQVAEGMTHRYDNDYEDQEAKKEKQKKHASFERSRNPFFIFNANYIVVLLMFVALIGNSIGRGFTQMYDMILVNLVFFIIYVFSMTYLNPLKFSSDDEMYKFPKFNALYSGMYQTFAKPLLGRMGKNLDQKPSSTLIVAFVLTTIGAFFSTMFYNSSFEIIALPIFLIYVARVFASNSFKKQLAMLGIMKWLLLLMFITNAILSVFFKTSIDYSLWVMISVFNTAGIWFKHMHIYRYSETHDYEETAE